MKTIYRCKVEGDEALFVQAANAREAAERYVETGDWAPDDGEPAVGTLRVMVWTPGDDVPEFITVRL